MAEQAPNRETNLHDVEAVSVASNEDGGRERERQGRREGDHLLGETLEPSALHLTGGPAARHRAPDVALKVERHDEPYLAAVARVLVLANDLGLLELERLHVRRVEVVREDPGVAAVAGGAALAAAVFSAGSVVRVVQDRRGERLAPLALAFLRHSLGKVERPNFKTFRSWIIVRLL